MPVSYFVPSMSILCPLSGNYSICELQYYINDMITSLLCFIYLSIPITERINAEQLPATNAHICDSLHMTFPKMKF